MRKIIGAAIAAAALFMGASASALVSVDSTGHGFVGKGDVQIALGWNNAQAQANAKYVSFSYRATDDYDVTCEWDTITGGKETKVIHHAVVVNRTSSVASTISYDARQKNQYTGYNLTGFSSTATTGLVPVVGDPCPPGSDNSGTNGIVTAVTLVSSTGGLYVDFGGLSVLIG